MSHSHKILDPVHSFIRFSEEEKPVLDSWPLQRLRHIHQNSLAFLVYPGATHSRFEHSLGVMELATRIFDSITDDHRRHPSCLSIFPDEEAIIYWRQVVRLAALCHDIGHLPFSHAAEEELLPEGVTHETLTAELILSSEMEELWQKIPMSPKAYDIAKLAVGPKYDPSAFSPWERLLCEVITGDVFGADRMDYLIRDSHYTGVAYGRFDYNQLIDTLQVLPTEKEGKEALTLGIDERGLRSAENLLLSRYFMFKQVYFHHVGRVYSLHLADFLKEWMKNQPGNKEAFPKMTDNEIFAEMTKAWKEKKHPGHKPAEAILARKHYKLLYKPKPSDREGKRLGRELYEAATAKFGKTAVRHDLEEKSGEKPSFPVLTQTNGIDSSENLSSILTTLPCVDMEYLFIDPELAQEAQSWLKDWRRQREAVVS